MPDYQTNAPQGWCGDWTRGAPMGRRTLAPDTRTAQELEIEAAQCNNFARQCERDKESRRTPDGLKPRYWQEAADEFRAESARLLAMRPAALERLALAPKITLQRVRLDSGGYDSAGAYWGQGEPLYWAADDTGTYDSTFRADDRNDAKAQVRATYPAARFYR